MNRHKLAYRLRLRANRIDRIAWRLEKLAIARGNDADLQALIAEQRKLAGVIRSDAEKIKPGRRRVSKQVPHAKPSPTHHS